MNHSLRKKIPLNAVGIFFIYFLIAFIIYYPALNADPLWDDWFFIFKSWTLKNSNALDFWKWGDFKRSWPLFYSTLSLMLKLWGSKYLYYHLLSLFLHVCNALLIRHFLKKIKGNYYNFLSLIYLVHPLNVFNVIWIIQIKTLMAIFFFLIALIFFTGNEKKSNIFHYWLSVLFYSASIFSKSVFIPIILLFPFYNKKRKLIPFLVVSLYSGALTLWNTHLFSLLSKIADKTAAAFISSSGASEYQRPVAVSLEAIVTPFDNVILTLVNLAKYSLYIFYPWDNLLIHTGTSISNSFFEMSSFIVLVMILYRAIDVSIFFNKVLSTLGIVFYLVSLLPLCGMVFIPIFQYSNFVEYWLAVPVLGLILVFSQVPLKLNFSAVACCVVIAFFVSSAVSIRSTPDPISIIKKSAEKSPDNILIPLILAKHYYFKADYVKSSEILLKVKRNLKTSPEKINLEIEEVLKGIRGERVNDYTL